MSPKGWKTYRDFVLKIESQGQGVYRVEAQGPAGEGTASFVMPFDEKDLKIFFLEIGRPRTATIRGAIPQPAQVAVDFGYQLFNAVFTDIVRDVFVGARTEAEIKNYGLRIRLRLTEAPELADLPWEYLHDSRDFLALSDTTPLIRYFDLPSPPRSISVKLPLRILVTVSDPKLLPVLNVEEERTKIQRALGKMIESQKLELEFTPDATLKTLMRTLRQARSQGRPFHVWHFIGHGAFDPNNQAGILAFCSPNGFPSKVDGFQLGTLFSSYPEIRLVLLNACEGARNSREDLFAGVASALVERGIPAVVGMQFEISDEAAIIFSEEFYTALVDGLPVDAAITEARRVIFFMPNWVEWATPVLFMCSPDGVLFNIQPEAAPARIKKKPKADAPRVKRAKPAPEKEAPAAGPVAAQAAPQKQPDDKAKRASELQYQGLLAHKQGRFDEAEALFRQSLAIALELQDEQGKASILNQLAMLVKERLEREKAAQAAQQAQERAASQRIEAGVLHYKGMLALKQGKLDEAEALFRQSLAIALELEDEQGKANLLNQLAMLAQERLQRQKATQTQQPATDGRIFPWGNEWDPKKLNAPQDKRELYSMQIGQYSPAGDSPYGLSDMCGNGFEWCLDWYDENAYQGRAGSTVKNPSGPKAGTSRVLRGGCYRIYRYYLFPQRWLARCAYRFHLDPHATAGGGGIRVVYAPSENAGLSGFLSPFFKCEYRGA